MSPTGIVRADDVTPAAKPDDGTRHIVVLGKHRPWIAEICISVQGRSHRTHWDEWLDGRFAELDIDENGHLDQTEMTKVAGADVAANPQRSIFDFFKRGKPAITGDGDGDDQISRDELADYLRGRREGAFRIEKDGTGNQMSVVDTVGKISDRIATTLDTDGDGSLSREELEAATTTAAKLDRNEDDLLSMSEVGVDAGQQIFYYNDNTTTPAEAADVLELPTEDRDVRELARRLVVRYRGEKAMQPGLARWELKWSNPKVFERFDADASGRLEEGELETFLRNPVSDLQLVVRFESRRWWRTPPKDAPPTWQVEPLAGTQAQPIKVTSAFGNRFRIVTGGDCIEFLAPQTLDQSQRTLVSNFDAQFESMDRDNNAYLDSGEANQNFYFQGLFDLLDANADGKVFLPEVHAFLERESRSARSRTRLIVADRGRNRFDLLDGNRNGTITARELVTAAERGMRWDRDEDGRVSDEEVPRFLRITLQPGRPNFQNAQYLLGGQGAATAFMGNTVRRPKEAPAWFRGMDRNQDADVSRREFLGPVADFDRLDADGDGLISVTEAMPAE